MSGFMSLWFVSWSRTCRKRSNQRTCRRSPKPVPPLQQVPSQKSSPPLNISIFCYLKDLHSDGNLNRQLYTFIWVVFKCKKTKWRSLIQALICSHFISFVERDKNLAEREANSIIKVTTVLQFSMKFFFRLPRVVSDCTKCLLAMFTFLFCF